MHAGIGQALDAFHAVAVIDRVVFANGLVDAVHAASIQDGTRIRAAGS